MFTYNAGAQNDNDGWLGIVTTSSDDIGLRKYYKKELDANGFKQNNTETSEDGTMWIVYENSFYNLVMLRNNSEKQKLYVVGLSWRND